TGYGRTYHMLDDGFNREDSVRDIGALLDWIEQQPELDAKRVAVYGGSYGGYMVLASLTNFPGRIKAGVDIVGIANFVTFLEKTSPYRQDLRRPEYGDERNAKMRAHLTKISPVNNAEKIQAALYVQHGANDPRVPAYEAEQIVKTLRRNGHTVWYMLAKDEGHGFSKKENRDLATLTATMFLQEQLTPGGS
ncbi:MAG: prolyl oligopeptidase family serine peptidase, partial [Phycisphaerae bacterium]